MKVWCGYNPAIIDGDAFKENEVVLNMTSYPNDGSVRIIDEVIVVKF